MSTKEQIAHAQFTGVAGRVRGELWLDRSSDRQARHRAEWPELWAAIDRLVELADEWTPMDRPAGPPTFGFRSD